jgi:ABC-type iron transport system FetAB ATPase subunit
MKTKIILKEEFTSKNEEERKRNINEFIYQLIKEEEEKLNK